jgi:hypothetical protein
MMPATTLVVPITRLEAGQPVASEIEVTYADGVLTIRSDWSSRRQRWRRETVYRVEAVGLSFILNRSPSDVARDGEPSYVVMTGKDQQCSCPGHLSHGRCKHLSAIVGLLEAGLLTPAGVEPIAEDW